MSARYKAQSYCRDFTAYYMYSCKVRRTLFMVSVICLRVQEIDSQFDVISLSIDRFFSSGTETGRTFYTHIGGSESFQ